MVGELGTRYDMKFCEGVRVLLKGDSDGVRLRLDSPRV